MIGLDEGAHDGLIAGWLGLLVDKTKKPKTSRVGKKKNKQLEVPVVKGPSVQYTIEQLAGNGKAGRFSTFCMPYNMWFTNILLYTFCIPRILHMQGCLERVEEGVLRGSLRSSGGRRCRSCFWSGAWGRSR